MNAAAVRPAGDPFAGEFRGKVVLVAGASGSLGERVASLFLACGAVCHLHAFRNAEGLRRLAGTPVEGARAPRTHTADLRDGAQAERLVADVLAESGRLDIVVSCIGKAVDDSLFLLDGAALRETLDANLLTAANLFQAALPSMAERRSGALVAVSSITGAVGQPMRSLYGAAKGAVNAYMKSLARHAAPLGVRVNHLLPQVVEAGMGDAMKQRIRELIRANTPLGRLATEEDIAWPVLFLCSSLSAFIAGESLKATGGLVTW